MGRFLSGLPEFLSGLPEVVPPEVELSILLGLPEFVSEEGVVVSGEKWSNSTVNSALAGSPKQAFL